MEYVKSFCVDRGMRQFLLICEKSTLERHGDWGLCCKVIMLLCPGRREHLFIQTVQITVGDKQRLMIQSMETIFPS